MLPGLDYTGISVAFYCHDGHGNFLFHKRSQHCRDQHGVWDPGGGKLEFGETPEEALRREVREEYGIECEINEVLGAISFFERVSGRDKHWIILPHIVTVDREKVVISDPRSMDEIGWFKLEAMPEPLHPSARRELAVYAEIFAKYKK